MHKVTEAPPASAGRALSPVGPLLSGRLHRCSLPGPSLLGSWSWAASGAVSRKGFNHRTPFAKRNQRSRNEQVFFKPQRAFLAPDLSNDEAESLCEEPGSRWFPSLPTSSSLHPHSPMGHHGKDFLPPLLALLWILLTTKSHLKFLGTCLSS